MAEATGAGPRPLFGRISMPNLLAAQVIGLLAGIVALLAGLDAVVALAVAVVAMLLPLIPVAKRTVLDWIVTWWRFRTRREYELGDTVDFRGPDDRSLGLYWDGSRVVTVVEVLPPRGGLTRISSSTVLASHLLPLPELAKCLNQHDILLSGIDIISHGHRSRAGTPAGKIYETLLGPLPATAWLPIAFFAFPSSWSASIFLVALASGIPVAILTWSGVSGVGAAYYDIARTLGAKSRFLVLKVAIPAAMPHVFVGLFMGLAAAFAVLVVAEMLGVKAGLGWYMQWAQGWGAYGNMYAALLLLAMMCSGLVTLLFRVRDRLLAWQKGMVRW